MLSDYALLSNLETATQLAHAIRALPIAAPKENQLRQYESICEGLYLLSAKELLTSACDADYPKEIGKLSAACLLSLELILALNSY